VRVGRAKAADRIILTALAALSAFVIVQAIGSSAPGPGHGATGNRVHRALSTSCGMIGASWLPAMSGSPRAMMTFYTDEPDEPGGTDRVFPRVASAPQRAQP
jgi:hypothetical protein